MEKVSKFVEKTMLPLATWVAKNKYLQTMSKVFISLLPVIILGAFSLILSKPLVKPATFQEGTAMFNFFTAWQSLCDTYAGPLKFLNAMTLGALSLWVTIGIADAWAKKYEMNNFLTIIVATVSFFLMNSEKVDATISTKYFGGEGIFSALLVTFISVELFRFLTKKGFGAIKFPDTVPASLQNSISSLLPMTLVLFLFALVSGIFNLGIGKSFPAVILSICAPLNFAIDSIVGIALVSTFGQIAWWFGIHNSAVLSVVSPMMYSNLEANAAAYAADVAGTALPFIVNQSFFYTYCTIGGSGATLAFVILLMRSKSEQMKAVGRLSILPAFFGINEPVIFGLPIMLNPVLLIPFIFVQIANIIVSYSAMAIGLVNRPMFYLGGTAPNIISQFFGNMDWRSIILWVVLVTVDLILWFPFFKTFEKQKLGEEVEQKNTVGIGKVSV